MSHRTTSTQGASHPVSLAEAARRTGLADSAAGMAAYCTGHETPLSGTALDRVDLVAFHGGPVPLLLPEPVVLEAGRL